VVNGVVVVGSAVADNGRVAAPSGEVRGFDARTGALRWTWDPVPQDPRDPAWPTWEGPGAHRAGAANAWSVLAADPERDLVFVPTASPSPDYYGGERPGDNRYANSVVALRASTGRVVWHFQTVHHDLWDYDNAPPPALVILRRDGRELPVVLQATKTGQLFVLHRETGEPVFPVEERPVPASDVAGERAAVRQPFSALPQLGLARLAAADVWGLTDADRAACRREVAALRNDGMFTPPSLRGTLVAPSNVGGAHWGGVAFDPVRQIAVVPVNRLAAVVQLLPRAQFDSSRALARRGERLDGDWEYAPMAGTPYGMRRRILRAPSGLPCTPPPFGALVAISLDNGRVLWEVPLGTMRGPVPEEVVATLPGGGGSPNLGGPVVTASGVVFIGGAVDRALRAFDIETGRELWRAALPAGAKATPMTYRVRGRQYVTVAAGGGSLWGKGDAIVTFALPDARADARPAPHSYGGHPSRRAFSPRIAGFASGLLGATVRRPLASPHTTRRTGPRPARSPKCGDGRDLGRGRAVAAPAQRAPEGGRPWVDDRAMLNGLLYVLRGGIPWRMVPRRSATARGLRAGGRCASGSAWASGGGSTR
jgi:quinoprotein glucose dehydrogenase